MMVIERFYFSTRGHIKAIFLKKTLDKSIKIEGFALKMMTFFKEAFQVNRKSYPERVRSALFHRKFRRMRKGPGKRFFKKKKTSAANDAATWMCRRRQTVTILSVRSTGMRCGGSCVQIRTGKRWGGKRKSRGVHPWGCRACGIPGHKRGRKEDV